MGNVERFIQDGGKIAYIRPGAHTLPANTKRPAIPSENSISIPSAKSCHKCREYNRGAGNKKCLACRNYKMMERIFDLRDTISIVPMVSELIEAFPAPPRPDNDLMAIIRQLPAPHAAVISMYYYGSLSVREIAFVMTISQSLAGKKLYRAVSDLRKKIALQYPEVKSRKVAKVSDLVLPNKYKDAC